MANYDVSNPVYSNELRKLETTDPAHADTFNPLFQQLLENDEVINKNLDNVAILEDAGEPLEPEIPTDSDLLGGQPKSYYEGLINTVGNRVTPIETIYPQLSNPNILINPNFKINQRGKISYNTPNAYTVDRWANFGESTTITPNSTGINITCTYTTDSNLLKQTVEHPKFYAGKQLTLTIKYKGLNMGSNSKFICGFVDGTNIYTKEVNTSIINGIAKVSGIISGNPAILNVILTKIGAGSLFSVNVEWMKLEVGSISTPFIQRLYTEELALCQRYYFDSMSRAVIMQGYNNSGSHHLLGNVFYPVEMRTIPTLKIYNSSNGMINHIRDTSTGADILLTSYIFNSIFNDTKGFSLIVIDGFTPVDGNFYDFRYTLDAEIY